MTDRPVLFASYSGLLGGAERVLLDCATRLDRPGVIACPDGPARRRHPQGAALPRAAEGAPAAHRARSTCSALTYELTQRAREHDAGRDRRLGRPRR